MRLLQLCAAAMALTALACPPSEGPVPAPTPAPGPAPSEDAVNEPAVKGPFRPAENADLMTLVKSNNAFAADLYGEVAKGAPGNFAASPMSISLALSMAMAGAMGDTSSEMSKTLHLSLDSDTTHRAFGTLLRSYAPKDGAQFELTIANRLFGAAQVAFTPAYVDITRDHYHAPLETLDFRADAEAARKHINDWVAESTKSRITDLLPDGSVKSNTLLVLTNAIYFNGTWAEKFEKAATVDKPFFAPGGEVMAPTMHMEEHVQYAEADDNQLISLAYRGSPIAMTIVLPRAKDGLAATEAAIAEGRLDTWVNAMRRATVDIALPKFKIAGASLSLEKVLTTMGMKLAFDEQRANFRGMAGGSPNLFIGDVFHKAFVDVHEDGTEAAAATGVVMYPTSAITLPSKPVAFIADRPFVFFIRDLQLGSILFMGRVTDPSR